MSNKNLFSIFCGMVRRFSKTKCWVLYNSKKFFAFLLKVSSSKKFLFTLSTIILFIRKIAKVFDEVSILISIFKLFKLLFIISIVLDFTSITCFFCFFAKDNLVEFFFVDVVFIYLMFLFLYKMSHVWK